MVRILGLSASLRNARFGTGSQNLVKEISALTDRESLDDYIRQQTKIRLDDLMEHGYRKRPFREIYRELFKMKGDRGLSNSEACLVAALWGAKEVGGEIEHCGLAQYYPMSGEPQGLDGLRERILNADGILLAGPVYFGDRGSVAQEFVEFLRSDPEVAAHVRDHLYAGVAVGAKRNGGQETTLIYQLVDMTNLNMLAVRNDSDTTAQYGGTSKAGDVGTAWEDQYGIDTSIGTGKRIAQVATLLERGRAVELDDVTRISVWLLQDTSDKRGLDYFQQICDEVEAREPRVKFRIYDFTEEEILRCIACDICPTTTGSRKDYRCIINKPADAFKKFHEDLVETDALLTAAYSPVDRGTIQSVYQRFIERTRYLRRDDYAFSDRLAAPMVISEVNSNQNLHIRMLTSLLRHHTVLHHPLIGIEKGELLNRDFIVEQGVSFARNAIRLTAGRLSAPSTDLADVNYNPVGYEISLEKRRRDEAAGRIHQLHTERGKEHEASRKRLRTG